MRRHSRDRGEPRQCQSAADIVMVLAHAQCMEIVELLAVVGERSVSEVADGLELSLPSVSRLLRILYENAIVEKRRDRHKHLYSLAGSVGVEQNGDLSMVTVGARDGSEVALKLVNGSGGSAAS